MLQDVLGMRGTARFPLVQRAHRSVLDGRTIVAADSADEREATAVADRPEGAVTVPPAVKVRRPGGSFSDPRLIGARAYTLDDDVVLSDEVDVGSAEGDRILTHELAHIAQARQRGDATVRRYIAGDLETQSIGPDYAKQLTDAQLEQDIAFLEQHLAGLKADSVDYQVASENLKVLGVEAGRRGYKSPALIRRGLVELFKSVFSEIKHVADVLPHLKAEFNSVTWIIPWQPDRPAWQHDPIDFVLDQLGWMLDALSASARMIELTHETEHDISVALLQQAGVRISSAMLGFSELRPFLYFVQAAIGIRYNAPLMDPGVLARPVESVRERIAPDLASFAKLETENLEAVAASSAATTQALFGELESYVELFTPFGARVFSKLPWQAEALLILVSALLEIPGGGTVAEEGGFTLPIRGGMMPAFAGGGSASMAAIAISAEQVTTLRRLVAIGAISTATVSAAFGTSLAVGLDVPAALTDLIGEGPEAGSIHVTGKTGAGMARQPRHHVMPQEERPWFEDRGMKGDLDIDQFTVDIDEGTHRAIHGGGNWRLGRTWPGEWNTMIMRELEAAEAAAGRMLRPNEILDVVARQMRLYKIPFNFVPYRLPFPF